MSSFCTKDGYTVIRRHYILPLVKGAKFMFFLALSFFLYWIALYYIGQGEEIAYIRHILFLFVFLTLNYAFISFILYLIYYSYNLIVIFQDQIVLIKCSLLMRDDIEVIDSYRIVKVDGFSRGFFANVLGYGNLVIEQQRNDVRLFHFVPLPYKILLIIKQQREEVLADRKRKYIISESDEEKLNEKNEDAQIL